MFRQPDRCTRREFLQQGAVGAAAAALTLADSARLPAATTANARNCIMLFLVGGPSQLETFDPKPSAPSRVRGPFGAIRTSVPGLHFSELLPRTAGIANKIAVVRSVHHTSAPIHETGHQLMQTGRLATQGIEFPNFGAVVGYAASRRSPRPSAVLPWVIENTGVSVGHGQCAGYLGSRFEPKLNDAVVQGEAESKKERYGRSLFGQSCLRARRLVESGTQFVTVNMFDTVFNKVTWDCHADGGSLASTLDDYRDTLCPVFDTAYSALIEDLHVRGMLDSTLVLVFSEFGRTPLLNPRGGRDHWTGCWSVLCAGAGIRGGSVVGSSDNWAAEPKDRPVDPAEIAATVYAALGVNPTQIMPGPDGKPIPLADAMPIRELLS